MFSSVDADNLVGIYGHPEFEILIQGLFPILPPPSLSHFASCHLDLSCCNKGEHSKNKSKRKRKKMFNSKSAAH